MKKMTPLALAFGLSLTAAQAADLTTMRRVPSVTAAPASSWTGFYLGAFGGGVFAGRIHSNDLGGDGGLNAIGGVQVGLRGGYDYQAGQFVYGAALDVAYSSAQQTTSVMGPVSLLPGFTNTVSMPLLASARLRAGYLMTPDWLLFATGGLALGTTRDRVNGPNNTTPLDVSATTVGYTLGLGTEYKITSNWSATLEYRYVNLGVINPGAWTNVPAGITMTDRIYPSTHTVSLGANYRF